MIRQFRLWGTPFTVTYHHYKHSNLGDVHSKGVVVHRGINLTEWLENQHSLRELVRRVEHRQLLRRLRSEGQGFVTRRPFVQDKQLKTVATEEGISPVVYQEIAGCLRPLAQ